MCVGFKSVIFHSQTGVLCFTNSFYYVYLDISGKCCQRTVHDDVSDCLSGFATGATR